MSGGKETPRQKMIGLMYLVLMALLALNVTKAVLDAFVAIEKNLQVGATTQLERGNLSLKDLKEAGTDSSNPEKMKKVKYYLSIIQKIDELTAKRVKEIDDLKLKILEKSGENISLIKNESEEAIVWIPYSTKSPLTPTKLNLMAIGAKDGFDVPMYEIIGPELSKVTGAGKELWNNYAAFRNEICDLVGTYSPPNGNSWKLKTTHINHFKDNNDLTKQVDLMLKKQAKFNSAEDEEVIKKIYMELSKNESEDHHEEKNLHWIARTFDHSPLVAAIASLTALQQEILSARASAITHIKGRVSVGDFSFNKIMPLAYGPAIANQGEEIELGVMMVAFDSDNQPKVTGDGQISYNGDGKGMMKVKVSGSNEMTLKGTVSIRKKTGEIKTEAWSHTVKIMKPQGTISQPGMNVLYRNYPNRIIGVASGFDQTILTPGQGNPQLTKSGDEYIVKPGSGRTCSIAIAGKNSVTNKVVQLGVIDYRIVNMPEPKLFLGNNISGSTISVSDAKNQKSVFANYTSDILLTASFSVISWDISISNGPPAEKGFGNKLTPAAINMLKQARPNSKIIISAQYKGSGYAGNIAGVINVK